MCSKCVWRRRRSDTQFSVRGPMQIPGLGDSSARTPARCCRCHLRPSQRMNGTQSCPPDTHRQRHANSETPPQAKGRQSTPGTAGNPEQQGHSLQRHSQAQGPSHKGPSPKHTGSQTSGLQKYKKKSLLLEATYCKERCPKTLRHTCTW